MHDVTIDPDMTFVDKFTTSTLDIAMSEVLREVYNKPSAEEGKPYGELWKIYYRQYKAEARGIYDETKDPLERNHLFDLLKEKYACKFKDCADLLFKERYENLLCTLGASGTTSYDNELVIRALGDKIRRQLATVVYLITYQDSCSDLEGGHKKSDYYLSSKNPGVSFCWEICADELHKNKGDNVCRRVSLDGGTCSTEILISAELDHLLT